MRYFGLYIRFSDFGNTHTCTLFFKELDDFDESPPPPYEAEADEEKLKTATAPMLDPDSHYSPQDGVNPAYQGIKQVKDERPDVPEAYQPAGRAAQLPRTSTPVRPVCRNQRVLDELGKVLVTPKPRFSMSGNGL